MVLSWSQMDCYWDLLPSQCVAHAAAHQPFDVGDGPNVMQLSSSVNKRCQPCCVQGCLRVLSTMCTPTTHPRVLQTGCSAWPLPLILLQHWRDKIPRRLTHIAEVFIWEAEIQAADVDASFFWWFIQKWGNATEHHVSQHSNTPHVCCNRDRCATDELWCSKLWISEQEVDITAVGGQLDCITEVNELNARCRRVEVDHDVLRLEEMFRLDFRILIYMTL